MTRKRRQIADSDVDRWIAQGFGQGEGDGYRSWFKVRDVPSLGRSTRIAALRHKHIHQLLSDVETGHFLVVDFRADVTEIRDQIALLPRGDTLRIAEALGVHHPNYFGTRTPIVMTSDLWVSRFDDNAQNSFVLCVKREEALQPGAKGLKRTIQKLAIERRFWQERGVDWHLVTQKDFDPIAVQTLGLLRPSRQAWRSSEAIARARQLAESMRDRRNRCRTFRDLLLATGWPTEDAYATFGLAVWKKWIALDLGQELRWGLPVALQRAC